MSVTTLNAQNYEDEVIASEKTVLIDFWASWCGPCRMISPVVDEISEEREDIKVCKINVDEEPALSKQFGIMSIPTLIVMEGGQLKNKSVGVISKDAILEML